MSGTAAIAEPRFSKTPVNGIQLASFEYGTPRAGEPTLLFVHATGFHGRVFDRIIESLGDVHAISLEQRGHGRSDKVRIEHWSQVGEDVASFVAALGLRNLIGIGHSMGAHAMVDGAAKSGAFERLLLLDPTIASPEAYAEAASQPASTEPHPASRRRSRFASPEEMIERLLPKSAFSLYEPRILDDYCRHGLLATEDGAFELACPPEVEASVYSTARTNGAIYDSVRSLDISVTIMRAKLPDEAGNMMDFASSPTWPGLAGEFPNARDFHLPDCTHFIPMQMPDRVVTMIREAIDAWREANG